MSLAPEQRSTIEPVGDTWPLPDIQHVPTPPTDWTVPGALLLASIGGFLLARFSSFAIGRWLPALFAATAAVIFVRAVSFLFGRYRVSPHRPRRLASGKWLLSTWSRTHSFSPDAIHAPRTREELLRIVEENGRAGRKMKPAGALHSWSPCAVTSDVSIQMGRLDQVLEVDKAALTIRAEAGIRMRDLYARMEAEGLALMSLPNVDTIQLGGAVANATHGTCIRAGSMSSMVSELELIHFVPGEGAAPGRAELLRLRRASTDPRERHLFDAAIASIGALGVVYSVTLQCVKPYHCYVHERALPFEELRGKFAETARKHYSVRFMVLVGLDIVFTKLQVPVEGPLVRATARSITNSRDMLVIKMIAFATERSPKRWRRTRRAIRWFTDSTARLSTEQMIATHSKSALLTWYDGELESRLHAAFVGTPFVNLEYAVPLDRIDAAVIELRDICRRYPMHSSSSLSLRPVGADDRGYLTPPNGQPVVYVDIPYIADLESTGLYVELEKKCLEYGGRCSWSRLLHAEPRELVKNFPQHAEFVRAKRELDPLNLFSNPFSDQICGL